MGKNGQKGLKPTKNGKFWTEPLENVSRETFVLQEKIRLFHVKHNLNENQINLFHVEHKKSRQAYAQRDYQLSKILVIRRVILLNYF